MFAGKRDTTLTVALTGVNANVDQTYMAWYNHVVNQYNDQVNRIGQTYLQPVPLALYERGKHWRAIATLVLLLLMCIGFGGVPVAYVYVKKVGWKLTLVFLSLAVANLLALACMFHFFLKLMVVRVILQNHRTISNPFERMLYLPSFHQHYHLINEYWEVSLQQNGRYVYLDTESVELDATFIALHLQRNNKVKFMSYGNDFYNRYNNALKSTFIEIIKTLVLMGIVYIVDGVAAWALITYRSKVFNT